ncbi:MAG: hypothetical protein EOP17_15530 [Rhizobiaceae bacterium]|nr:MAG: hypothetical protein EOP17_15530 [Rhizobiaceae bacterium]
MKAIAMRQTVTSRYNGEIYTLAPHALFERHGELFVQALNMGKSWKNDADRKLGQFKLAGLAAMELLDSNFEPLPIDVTGALRQDDVLVMAV